MSACRKQLSLSTLLFSSPNEGQIQSHTLWNQHLCAFHTQCGPEPLIQCHPLTPRSRHQPPEWHFPKCSHQNAYTHTHTLIHAYVQWQTGTLSNGAAQTHMSTALKFHLGSEGYQRNCNVISFREWTQRQKWPRGRASPACLLVLLVCCSAAAQRPQCTSEESALATHTHTKALGDVWFNSTQEAGALEVCHRDSSLKLMEGDRGRKNGRWREGGWFVWGWRVGRQTGASEDEGLEQRYYKRRNWQQNDGGRWRIKRRKEERMEPRVSAHGSVIHMTFKQPRCHSLPVHPSLTGHILLGFFRLLSMFYLKLPLFFLLSASQEIPPFPHL